MGRLLIAPAIVVAVTTLGFAPSAFAMTNARSRRPEARGVRVDRRNPNAFSCKKDSQTAIRAGKSEG
jgi:hypothetical protein